MSYYCDKAMPLEKFLYRRQKELEYKLHYWTKLVHFKSKTRERAVAFIEKEKRFVDRFIEELQSAEVSKTE